MGKADKKRAQNKADYEGSLAQDHLNEQWKETGEKNAFATQQWTDSTQKQGQDYDRVMSGYKDFADTGGFSGQDIQDIRARAISPLRSIYSSANREVDRQRGLQGGYSPNYTAAKAKMSRELGYGMSDAMTNANASIAQMVQQGKLAGLQGQNQLYSSTPGLSALYGSQALQSQGQRLQNQGLQNQKSLSYNQQDQGGGGFNPLGLLGQGLGLIPKLFPGGGKKNDKPNTPATPTAPSPISATPRNDVTTNLNPPTQQSPNPEVPNPGIPGDNNASYVQVPIQGPDGTTIMGTQLGDTGYYLGPDGYVYDINGTNYGQYNEYLGGGGGI